MYPRCPTPAAAAASMNETCWPTRSGVSDADTISTTGTPCSAARTAPGSANGARTGTAPGSCGARDRSRTSSRWAAPMAASGAPPGCPAARSHPSHPATHSGSSSSVHPPGFSTERDLTAHLVAGHPAAGHTAAHRSQPVHPAPATTRPSHSPGRNGNLAYARSSPRRSIPYSLPSEASLRDAYPGHQLRPHKPSTEGPDPERHMTR